TIGSPVDVRVLGPDDDRALEWVASGVFDHHLQPALVDEFLRDPRHHIAVALEGKTVVGFASAVHYIHPDKPAELWINEVAVAPAHQNRGLGSRILRTLLDHGRTLGCGNAWVLTDRNNAPAMRLYAGAGGKQASGETVMFEFPLP